MHSYFQAQVAEHVCEYIHRCTPEILEPALSVSQHKAQISSLQVFLIIKITAFCQVCMSVHLLWSEHEGKTHVNTAYGA